MIDSTFTATHAGFSGFGRDWFVWEDTDPHFTTTLHKTGECDTCRLDLASLEPAGLKRLQTEFAKGQGIATMSSPFHATAMLSAVLCT
jgi:hypothetical protein